MSINSISVLSEASASSYEERPSEEGKILYLISVIYDGEKKSAVLRFYNPNTGKMEFIQDKTGHKPYLLTDASPEDVERIVPENFKHRVLKAERVEKYDVLSDRKLVLTKVEVSDPLAIGGAKPKDLRTMLKEAGFNVWEANIKYYDSYTYDIGLIPGMPYRIKGDQIEPVASMNEEEKREIEKIFGEEGEKVLEIAFEMASMLRHPVPKMKCAAIDIEVAAPAFQVPSPSEPKRPIIAAAIVGDDIKRVYLLKRGSDVVLSEDFEVIQHEDEISLIREFINEIKKYAVIYTFNGDNFDLPYLAKRAKELGITNTGIRLETDRALLDEGIHIDLYKLFSNRSIQVYVFKNRYLGYTLDEVSEGLLGEKKVDIGSHDIANLPPDKLARYCIQDAKLTFSLANLLDNGLLKLLFIFSRISRMSLEEVSRHGISQWIKSMIYSMYRRRNWLIPNSEDVTRIRGSKTFSRAIIKGKKYMGAIVLAPRPGVHFKAAVLDFASMYPSIIKRWRISFETINCPHEECKMNKPVEELPHWVCSKGVGIVPEIIGVLRDLRVKMYKKMAKNERFSEEERNWFDTVQNSLKVLLNASYGVFGFEEFPLYSPPAAEMITAIARKAIMSAVREAENMSMSVIYGDTDSLFIEDAPIEKLQELERRVEASLGIDLELDKVYRYVVLSKLKKNYLGVTEDGHVDVKGLLGKKRNIPDIVKKAFFETLDELSRARNKEEFEESKKKIGEIIKKYVNRLRSREFEMEEVCFRSTLNKRLGDYVKTTPQHVKAARLLEERLNMRIVPGDVISYVKVTGREGVKPVELAGKQEVDVDKYIEIMRSTFQQILDALDLDFDSLAKGKTSESLEGFL
ncbi:MAG: DNA-directed DNA polymerase I [Candidatus Methanodesulfokora washburnensis]|jgi:DNA polymerase I|uniref:DNA polymerase n=1 Tax=Candidatus Methanodesulfokora washburnensis TaxID=2478471 RepID=A0A429GRA6_9CREN|nr:DNA-directed DNA polymerase I [Candidatus Methanodesulfokores washburnensis]RSN76219.1 DNA-directed DNA polymerase I [Candidatus Methanodesulfokores washburnensis]